MISANMHCWKTDSMKTTIIPQVKIKKEKLKKKDTVSPRKSCFPCLSISYTTNLSFQKQVNKHEKTKKRKVKQRVVWVSLLESLWLWKVIINLDCSRPNRIECVSCWRIKNFKVSWVNEEETQKWKKYFNTSVSPILVQVFFCLSIRKTWHWGSDLDTTSIFNKFLECEKKKIVRKNQLLQ